MSFWTKLFGTSQTESDAKQIKATESDPKQIEAAKQLLIGRASQLGLSASTHATMQSAFEQSASRLAPLDRAAATGDIQKLRSILDNPPSDVAANHKPAFDLAIAGGHLPIIELLFERGMKADSGTLLTAALAGRQEVLSIMLARGSLAPNDIQTTAQLMEIWAATGRVKPEIVAMLKEHGASQAIPQVAEPSSIAEFVPLACKSKTLISAQMGDVGRLIGLLKDALPQERPDLDAAKTFNYVMEGLIVCCPQCGQLNENSVAMLGLAGTDIMSKAIFGGPNVAALGQGRCPKCGGNVANITFTPPKPK